MKKEPHNSILQFCDNNAHGAATLRISFEGFTEEQVDIAIVELCVYGRLTVVDRGKKTERYLAASPDDIGGGGSIRRSLSGVI